MLARDTGIKFDASAFEPRHVMGVTHSLTGHPLLQLSSIVELGERLAKRGAVRTHNGNASAGTSFSDAPNTHPTKLSVEEALHKIESADAWLSLHNVQTDPLYRTLINDVLDDVKPMVEKYDPGMHDYAGWIFVTSPNAVTPYHMDHENNFILQIRGQKLIHVWDPLDRDVVTERSLELFHAKLSRELVIYREEYQSRAYTFDAKPGMGAYMPQTAPHWVKNGNEVSITISFTYYTRATERRRLLYRGNQRLRELGLHPRPIGGSPARDALALVALRGVEGAKRIARGRSYVKNPTYELKNA
jgi:Cupin-like domain